MMSFPTKPVEEKVKVWDTVAPEKERTEGVKVMKPESEVKVTVNPLADATGRTTETAGLFCKT